MYRKIHAFKLHKPRRSRKVPKHHDPTNHALPLDGCPPPKDPKHISYQWLASRKRPWRRRLLPKAKRRLAVLVPGLPTPVRASV